MERAFDKRKRHCVKTIKPISEHTRQKRIDDQNLPDFKDTISDLRKQIALLEADR